MIKKTIKFNTIEDVKYFCNTASHCDFNMDLVRGRYVVDGKSLMGILSLSLDKQVNLEIHVDTEDECKNFLQKINNFLFD